jgi:membrane protein
VNTRFLKHYEQLRAFAIFWRKRFRQAHLNQVAGSLAFTTTLALVPMFSIATILIGYLPGFVSWREALQKWLVGSLVPGAISNGVSAYVTQFSSKAKGLTLFGSVGLVLTTFFMLITIERAFNQVWGVKIPRSFLKRMFIFVTATFLGPLLLGLSIYLTSLLVSASQGWIRHLPLAFELLASILPIILTALTFLMVYKMGPSAFVEWKDALTGGLVAAVVFEFAKLGFAYFVAKMPVYKTLYGAFAIVPLFLLWIYLTWWVTMAGAVLTAALPELRAGRLYTSSKS